ncbi:MAG: VOC family protein [Gammaproteobacteria bacterium]|jgi:hypothetical protein
MKNAPVLRVARPTDNLEKLAAMYEKGLGLAVLGRFRDHDGFDGIILGQAGWPYHLEFTSEPGHPAGRAPTEDHLLVFYLPEGAAWERACERMQSAGFAQVASWNPYWDRVGRTFEDIDGYRVVLQNAAWEAE